jgi:hypothetical protein
LVNSDACPRPTIQGGGVLDQSDKSTSFAATASGQGEQFSEYATVESVSAQPQAQVQLAEFQVFRNDKTLAALEGPAPGAGVVVDGAEDSVATSVFVLFVCVALLGGMTVGLVLWCLPTCGGRMHLDPKQPWAAAAPGGHAPEMAGAAGFRRAGSAVVNVNRFGAGGPPRAHVEPPCLCRV